MFFSLFSIIGKTSSFIGPIVSSAIIDASRNNNNSTPFYFLFGLTIASFAFLVIFLDVEKSRVEQAEYLEKEAEVKAKIAERLGSSSSSSEDIDAAQAEELKEKE